MKRLLDVFLDCVLIVIVAGVGLALVPTTQYVVRLATETPAIPPAAYQVDLPSVSIELEPLR